MAKIYLLLLSFLSLIVASDQTAVLPKIDASDELTLNLFNLNRSSHRVLSLIDLSARALNLKSQTLSKVLEKMPSDLKEKVVQSWYQQNYSKIKASELLRPVNLMNSVKLLHVLPDGRLLTKLKYGLTKLVNYKTSEEVVLNGKINWDIRDSRFLDNGDLLTDLTCSQSPSKHLLVWDSKTGEFKFKIEHSGGLAYSSTEILAIAVDKKSLNVFSIDTGELVRTFYLNSNDVIRSVHILTDESILLEVRNSSCTSLMHLDSSLLLKKEIKLDATEKLVSILPDGLIIKASEDFIQTCFKIDNDLEIELGREQRIIRQTTKNLSLVRSEYSSLFVSPEILERVDQINTCFSEVIQLPEYLLFFDSLFCNRFKLYNSSTGFLECEFEIKKDLRYLGVFEDQIVLSSEDHKHIEIWNFEGKLVHEFDIGQSFDLPIVSIRVLYNHGFAVLLKNGELIILKSCITLDSVCDLDQRIRL